MDRTTPDRLNGRIMLLLVLVGAALAFVAASLWLVIRCDRSIQEPVREVAVV